MFQLIGAGDRHLFVTAEMVGQGGAVEKSRALGDEMVGWIPIQQQFTDACRRVKLTGFHVQIDQPQAGGLGGFRDEIRIEHGLQRG